MLVLGQPPSVGCGRGATQYESTANTEDLQLSKTLQPIPVVQHQHWQLDAHILLLV